MVGECPGSRMGEDCRTLSDRPDGKFLPTIAHPDLALPFQHISNIKNLQYTSNRISQIKQDEERKCESSKKQNKV